MLQFESSSHVVDGKGKYEEFHESYFKIDGGKKDSNVNKEELKDTNKFSFPSELPPLGKLDDICSKRKKMIDHYGSFKGYLESTRESEEKRKSGVMRLIPSASFNDKLLNPASLGSQQRKKSAIYRLSFKRRSSCDGEELTEQCNYWSTR